MIDFIFGIFFIIGYLGWGITLYIYSKKFKKLVDSSAQKVKNRIDNVVEKAQNDSRKEA